MQALNGEALTVCGDGSQSRSFCYVDDLIEGMNRLINGEHPGPINLSNPYEFTIRQLAELIREHIIPELPINTKALPEDDPLTPTNDRPGKTGTAIAAPSIFPKEGLEAMINNFRARLGQSSH